MRSIIAVMVCLILVNAASGQSLKKYPISSSGCAAYFFCDPGTFDLSRTPDSSDVYTGQCASDNMNYGVICVKMKGQIADLEKSEGVLMSYMDYLKASFNITKSAGYGKGHRLKNRDDNRGVIDYWEDKEKQNWKVKGWTDGKYIVFMYINSPKLLNETKGDIFLNGLVLPGM